MHGKDANEMPGTSKADLSPWAPLRSKVFLALFIAQLFSNLGTLMHNVGASWLMGDLGATKTMVALVQTATFLPVILVGIPSGALADMFDRRKVLIATQICMLMSAGAMAVLAFAHAISPMGLLGLTFVLGTGAAVMGPAWQAIQPDLVPKEQFGQALALGSMTYNVGRAIGPAIGGVIIAAAGPGWVFAINAVSFVGTMVVLIVWRGSKHHETSLPKESFRGATVTGLRYCMNSPMMRTALIRGALVTLPACAVTALLAIDVRGPLHWSSGGYGLLLACYGGGASIAAAMRPRVVSRLKSDAVMAVTMLTIGAGVLVQGYVHDRVVVGVGLAFAGAGWSLGITEIAVFTQSVLPAWVRARGMAVYMLVVNGSFALGSAVWGVAANRNLPVAHLVPALVLVVGSLAGWRWPMVGHHDLDLSVVPQEAPVVAMDVRMNDGPVLISKAYRVHPSQIAEFNEVMTWLQMHRRRMGGYQWSMFRDLSDPDRYVEHYRVNTWGDRLRQDHRRTAAAEVWLQRLARFADGPETHFLSTEGATGAAAGEADRGPELEQITGQLPVI